MMNNTSLLATVEPFETITSLIIPSLVAVTSFSNFIASITHRTSPFLTEVPTLTLTSNTLPPIGAKNGEPSRETGALTGASV